MSKLGTQLDSIVVKLYSQSLKMGSANPESKFSDILKQNGILEEISKVTFSKPTDLLGEQFGSVIEYVTIEFKNKKREDCHLFAKKMLAIPDPTQRNLFEEVMLKEGFYLTTFVQHMNQLCTERIG